jgi:multidrug efflux system outer membrane protein
MRRLSLIVSACALAACVGEPYSRPDLAVPSQYRFALAQSQTPADTIWWARFGDPTLDGLVTEALANNEDLRIAAARVDQFQGAKVTTRAPLFPTIGYTGSTGEESR